MPADLTHPPTLGCDCKRCESWRLEQVHAGNAKPISHTDPELRRVRRAYRWDRLTGMVTGRAPLHRRLPRIFARARRPGGGRPRTRRSVRAHSPPGDPDLPEAEPALAGVAPTHGAHTRPQRAAPRPRVLAGALARSQSLRATRPQGGDPGISGPPHTHDPQRWTQ